MEKHRHRSGPGSATRTSEFGLGLAVPINTTTRRIINTQLVEGRVRRADPGVVGMPASPPGEVAEHTGQRAGLRVVEVVPGGPGGRFPGFSVAGHRHRGEIRPRYLSCAPRRGIVEAKADRGSSRLGGLRGWLVSCPGPGVTDRRT